MNTNDPIIAAIEAHRRACVETRAAFVRQSGVENEVLAGVRVPAGEAESDPQWIAADDAAGEALAVQDDLAMKLLETQPTTIAGAAALLTYYVDAVTTMQPEVVFPQHDGNGRPFESKLIDEPRRFGYFIVRNVAAALSNLAAAGEAIEQHGLAHSDSKGPRLVAREYCGLVFVALTTDAVQLTTVMRRHFKMAAKHYKLNDADQTESHEPIAFGVRATN
jgi:hypothetical protein